MDFSSIGHYLANRLSEKSTWTALGTMMTGIGVVVKPDQWELIMAIGMGFFGFIGTVLPAKVMEKNVAPAAPTEPTTDLAKAVTDKVVQNTTAEKLSSR